MAQRTDIDLALVALAAGAGALLPLQALVNGRLGAQLGNPLWASAVQNLVGAAAMLTVILALRPAAPSPAQLGGAPWWIWVGGALGMVYVVTALTVTPRVGAASAMAAVIVGQLASAVALDHFGVLHARRPITPAALVGLLLLVVGALLILRRSP